jgi:hypothetical protein
VLTFFTGRPVAHPATNRQNLHSPPHDKTAMPARNESVRRFGIGRSHGADRALGAAGKTVRRKPLANGSQVKPAADQHPETP